MWENHFRSEGLVYFHVPKVRHDDDDDDVLLVYTYSLLSQTCLDNVIIFTHLWALEDFVWPATLYSALLICLWPLKESV